MSIKGIMIAASVAGMFAIGRRARRFGRRQEG